MALQGSGAISISQIKTELGSSSNSLRALSAAAGKSAPDSMSEFYGYASYTPPSYSSGAGAISGNGTQASPYVVTTSWSGGKQPYPPEYYTWEEVWTNRSTMTQVNFTNQTSAQQRMNVSFSVAANFCSYNGTPFDIDGDSYNARSRIFVGGNIVSASYTSNGSQSPQARFNGQTRSQTFTQSVGANIYFAGSAYQDTFIYNYAYQNYFFPCGESNYGQVPNPYVAVTMNIWFEKV